MNTTTHLRRLLAAALLATGLAAGAMAPAAGASAGASDVPGEIVVPEGNKLFLVAHASGVQIYSCNATASGPKWGFVAPRADLYGTNGKLIATHFGGPTWEAKDGSWVVAKRDNGVTVDPTAIPWLRLSRVSGGGSDGDRLAETSFIQRTETAGGLEPAAIGCNPSTVGTVVEVPYTADYLFWNSVDE
jgi:hypothetical protein